jgi:large subunit ribosomal protein L21
MFAVITTGGKQYRVASGDIINVEKLSKNPGDKLAIPAIAIFNDKNELVSLSSTVEVEVLENIKDQKKIIFKKERRTTHKKRKGHRQKLDKIKILKIA